MKHLLFLLLWLAAFRPHAMAQPGFCGAPYSTFYSANIFIANNLNPTLDGAILPFGSHIIALYGAATGSANVGCAGFIQWNGNNSAMVINGADGSLPGYVPNEPYRFLVQLPDGCLIDSIAVTYDTSGIYSNPGFFIDGGLSRLASFHAFRRDWLIVEATTGFCGPSTAGLTATADGYGGPFQFAWNTGDTSAALVNLADGPYAVMVTDTYGCSLTNTAQAINLLAMLVQLQSGLESGGNACQSVATVSGGTAPFTYVWSNDQTDSMATDLPDGPFSVTITDANGCTAEKTDVCMTVGVSAGNDLTGWCLGPNPTTGWVWLSANLSSLPQATLTLTDFSGKTLLQHSNEVFGPMALDLGDVPAGLYFLQITTASNASSKTFKIIKQ